MHRKTSIILSLFPIVVATGNVHAQTSDPGRLYAVVHTTDGRSYEGFVRWDQNEGHWSDVLNAEKRIPRRHVREVRELAGRSPETEDQGFRLFGIRIGLGGDIAYPTSSSSGIRLGYVDRLQVLDDEFVLLTLQSGIEQELRRNSTDLGTGNRGILVRSLDGPAVDLRWRDVDVVDFQPAPDRPSAFGHRLYGEVETVSGERFAGWITWDMDEIFGNDELDGSADGARTSIAFNSIRSIARGGGAGARVVTVDGTAIRLRGTNDVNAGNRGILVGDPSVGQVTVPWRAFASATFVAPPPDGGFEAFQDVYRLRGTVATRDGRTVTGLIRWDNDEEWSWEMLDGEFERLEVDVEFSRIAMIAKEGDAGVRVTLRSGRSLGLGGSNDVDRGNKGIVVTDATGEAHLVRWRDFVTAEFEHPEGS